MRAPTSWSLPAAPDRGKAKAGPDSLMASNHMPLRPGASSGRITSGIAGGIAGGLLFGALLLTSAVAQPDPDAPTVGASAVELLGTNSIAVLWLAHMAMSVFLGIVFAMIVTPESLRSSMLLGIVYGALLWLATYMIALRTLTGAAFAFDAAAAYALIGHLLYGAGLGLVYVAFHRLEVREAILSDKDRWRRWGRRERDYERGRPR